MKNILALLIMGLFVVSCGSTKEIQEEEVVVEEETRQAKTTDNVAQNANRAKKRGTDPEQLAAQLGLSEEQEVEFVSLWESTGKQMRETRQENKGNSEALLTTMKAIKNERVSGLKRILTSAQMSKYYEIMEMNRSKFKGKGERRRG